MNANILLIEDISKLLIKILYKQSMATLSKKESPFVLYHQYLIHWYVVGLEWDVEEELFAEADTYGVERMF